MNYIRRIFQLLRYRFFLFAGIFPYLLGFAVAYHKTHVFLPFYFFLGFLGLLFVFIGVETFNEYFDYKFGGDRIFQLQPTVVPEYVLWLGILAFILAGFIALYLTIQRGVMILLFAFLGFIAAAFYVGPPLRWVYRGLGEFVIFLSYGPLMTMGSYFLFTQRLNFDIFWISLIPGLLIFAVSLVNEMPDYFQDKLVGKKNIVVRLGRKKSALFYEIILFSCFLVVALGLVFKQFPIFSSLIFLGLPLVCRNILIARKHYDYPEVFIPAIRGSIILYLVVITIFIGSYLI